MNQYVEYLEKIPTEKQLIMVTNKRTVKDIVAHMAGWKLEATKCFINLVEKGKKPWFFGKDDLSEFNESLYNTYKDLSYIETIELLKQSYQRRDELIKKYGKERLIEAGLDWMFEDNVESHAIYHINQIKNALGNK